jgi:hypothetical protein
VLSAGRFKTASTFFRFSRTSAENVIVEVTVGDVIREVNLDLVAKGDTESAAVVVPAHAAGSPDAEVLSYTNP